MESIGNMLIDLAKGTLPWDRCHGKTKVELYEAIKKCKQETPLEILCKDLPREFLDYMNYCRGLRFEEEPNYKKCIELFEGCMKNLNLTGFEFQWKKNSKIILPAYQMSKNKFVDKKTSSKYLMNLDQQNRYPNPNPSPLSVNGKVSGMKTPSKIN